jgi:hypothetical protein
VNKLSPDCRHFQKQPNQRNTACITKCLKTGLFSVTSRGVDLSLAAGDSGSDPSWCREGGRTPTRLPSADFEFAENAVSL